MTIKPNCISSFRDSFFPTHRPNIFHIIANIFIVSLQLSWWRMNRTRSIIKSSTWTTCTVLTKELPCLATSTVGRKIFSCCTTATFIAETPTEATAFIGGAVCSGMASAEPDWSPSTKRSSASHALTHTILKKAIESRMMTKTTLKWCENFRWK